MSRERIAELEAEHEELVFASFDQGDAWRLGRAITEAAISAGRGVAVDIRRPGFVLFRSALGGTTPDQETWIAAKARTVFRMECSSALIAERFSDAGIDAASIGWLPFPEYALTGGSVPIRVKDVGVVGAVTASGLSSDDDHAIVVAGLREMLAAL
ncbi:heme-binding protein [Agromyces sp. ISL-38]|uniref:heme-degrading domain-containing protein n=1 Tax=Agromyces sp. ISL-38 TaxID=2819107 RepID=UPI001BEC5B01|nr:heme-binding protein [Agromyces sp. ISL-38]MBT2498584.1 heme-binding protein [Agromyces sp. ISL-38]